MLTGAELEEYWMSVLEPENSQLPVLPSLAYRGKGKLKSPGMISRGLPGVTGAGEQPARGESGRGCPHGRGSFLYFDPGVP